MDWPVATVLLGTLGTLAVGVMKMVPRRGHHGGLYARATDMADIRARLINLEHAHHTMRAELRSDIKELQQSIRQQLAEALRTER